MIGIVILNSTMPIVNQAISSYFSTYVYMAFTLFLFFVVLFRYGSESMNRVITICLPFVVYVIMTYFVKTDSVVLWGYQSLLFLQPIVLSEYLLYDTMDSKAGIGRTIFLSILITVISTIIGTIQYPYAARVLATIADSKDPLNVLYNWHNMGGYSFVYSVVLLYPLVIFSYKQKKIPLVISITLSVAIFALAIITEYATALLLITITTTLYFFKRDLKKKDIIILGVLMIVFGSFLSELISSFLQYMAGLLNSVTLQDRILALSGGTTALEALDDNRIELYREAFNIFLNHPIFGTMFGNGAGRGGHSQILITLAQHGIIGGLVMFCMYRKIYRLFFKPFSEVPGYGFYLWIYVEAIVLSLVNTSFFFPVLVLYAPVLFCYINGYANIYQDDWS